MDLFTVRHRARPCPYAKRLRRLVLAVAAADDVHEALAIIVRRVKEAILELARAFEGMDDACLRARAEDVRAVGRRILVRLRTAEASPAEYPLRCVLVGEEISIARIAEVPAGQLAGIACARLRPFSHRDHGPGAGHSDVYGSWARGIRTHGRPRDRRGRLHRSGGYRSGPTDPGGVSAAHPRGAVSDLPLLARVLRAACGWMHRRPVPGIVHDPRAQRWQSPFESVPHRTLRSLAP